MTTQAPNQEKYKTRLKASEPQTWHPQELPCQAPRSGVELSPSGFFDTFLHRNIDYLLNSFSVDEMLYPFRVRAGQPNPPRERNIDTLFDFWCRDFLGSETGRFLMGAANTLRWIRHDELRRRLEFMIDEIGACQEADGYCFAFPRERMRHAEEGSYARCWFTQGMIDAGAVYPKAYEIIRRGHDWFNTCEYLPELIYMLLGYQGHTASTQMYLSPVGKPEDLQVAEKYYLQDWWIDLLIAGDPEAIWLYPLDRPHLYSLTAFEAYFDHYQATGEQKLLDAVMAVWNLYRENWMHTGGPIALCEGRPYPPKTWCLCHPRCTGELCGSVFWALLNHRLHRVFPDDERFIAEIERAIYNVLFANCRAGGIRYHAALDRYKEAVNAKNTCCEVHGTRLCAMLPQFIFSQFEEGLSVNLFEACEIKGACKGVNYHLAMHTTFPIGKDVSIFMQHAHLDFTLRVRIPEWASDEVAIHVNGRLQARGVPGSYVAIHRSWEAGDQVSFILPASLRTETYQGIDQPFFIVRHALHYGPILLAVCGPLRKWKSYETVILDCRHDEIIDLLEPIDGKPLHFTIKGHSELSVKPYWEVDEESFSAVPIYSRDGPKSAWLALD